MEQVLLSQPGNRHRCMSLLCQLDCAAPPLAISLEQLCADTFTDSCEGKKASYCAMAAISGGSQGGSGADGFWASSGLSRASFWMLWAGKVCGPNQANPECRWSDRAPMGPRSTSREVLAGMRVRSTGVDGPQTDHWCKLAPQRP